MKRIPLHLTFDMQLLIDHNQCEQVETDDELATRYVSLERLWHGHLEEPRRDTDIIVEYGTDDKPHYKVWQYSSKDPVKWKDKYFRGHGGLAFRRWAYLSCILF